MSHKTHLSLSDFGTLHPLTCEYVDGEDNTLPWPLLPADQWKHFSRLIWAWAFILSSRWVEILKIAGETASMKQSKNVDRENFWDVVVGPQWHATLSRGGQVFFAPWTMECSTIPM